MIGGEYDNADSIAARLLLTFGSIDRVLSAHPESLSRFIDDADLVSRIAAAKTVVMEGLGEQVRRARFDLADRSMQRWVVGLFKGLQVERVHTVFLDREQHLLFDEPCSSGNLQGVSGNLRAIVRSGIALDASAVVLMHNHPSGNPNPSAADIAETRRIRGLLENLDMRLQDHLIVSGNTIFSMRGGKLL